MQNRLQRQQSLVIYQHLDHACAAGEQIRRRLSQIADRLKPIAVPLPCGIVVAPPGPSWLSTKRVTLIPSARGLRIRHVPRTSGRATSHTCCLAVDGVSNCHEGGGDRSHGGSRSSNPNSATSTVVPSACPGVLSMSICSKASVPLS